MRRTLFSLAGIILIALAVVYANTALTALTNTARFGPILTIGAHTNVLTAPSNSFYGGRAVFTYSRTKTAAWVDTIYVPGNDSTRIGYDSSCVVYLQRENGSWLKAGGGNFVNNYPAISQLVNPAVSGRKANWLVLTFPAADTLTSAKLVIEKPFGRR